MSKAGLRAYVLRHYEDDKALTTKFPPFSQVQLTRNIPQFNLCYPKTLPPLPK